MKKKRNYACPRCKVDQGYNWWENRKCRRCGFIMKKDPRGGKNRSLAKF